MAPSCGSRELARAIDLLSSAPSSAFSKQCAAPLELPLGVASITHAAPRCAAAMGQTKPQSDKERLAGIVKSHGDKVDKAKRAAAAKQAELEKSIKTADGLVQPNEGERLKAIKENLKAVQQEDATTTQSLKRKHEAKLEQVRDGAEQDLKRAR